MCSDIELRPPGIPATDVLLSVPASDVSLFHVLLPEGDDGSPTMILAVAPRLPVAPVRSGESPIVMEHREQTSPLIMSCSPTP